MGQAVSHLQPDQLEFKQQLRLNREKADTAGIASPTDLLSWIHEDGEALHELINQHVISINAYSPRTLLQLFRLSAKFESNPARYIRFNSPLKGKILINAFYEPSTRTRLSFDSAWHRLGGDSINITDPSTTGLAKGESLSDIAEMFNHYGDCVVLRDTSETAIYEMATSLKIPIINAGNGIGEHPTQAMTDLYTILKWRPSLCRQEVERSDRIRIGIIGVPSRMRTVRSLLQILGKFPQIVEEIVILHDPKTDPAETMFDAGQREALEQSGLKLRLATRLNDEVGRFDVTYINAIAWVGDGFEVHGSNFQLSSDTDFKEGSIVLHPLARGRELCSSLDETPHNWYFAQARGAVFLRMALLTCMVERTDQVMDVI